MERLRITAKDNQFVKDAAGLLESAKRRREQGCFLTEGVRLCMDGLRSGFVPKTLFYTEQALLKYPDAVKQLEQKAEKAALITDEIAVKLSDTRTPQGIFCVFPMLDKILDLVHIYTRGRFIALENLQDPSNLGTVLRTAEALGLSGCILAGHCCDPFSPKVTRGSMGAVFRIPLYRVKSGAGLAHELARKEMRVYAAVPDDKACPITRCGFGPGSVLLIGNEANGLTEETVRACSCAVTIPMLGRAESLNAATAAAISMWEMVRGQDSIKKGR